MPISIISGAYRTSVELFERDCPMGANRKSAKLRMTGLVLTKFHEFDSGAKQRPKRSGSHLLFWTVCRANNLLVEVLIAMNVDNVLRYSVELHNTIS